MNLQHCLHVPLLALGCLAMLLAGGCGRPRVVMLDEAHRRPPVAPEQVELFEDGAPRLYDAVALVDSNAYRLDNTHSRSLMERDIRRRAAQLGADAVHRLEEMEEEHRGAVPDEQAPIPVAWRQARYTKTFLRGEAVVYRNSEETDTIEKGATP